MMSTQVDLRLENALVDQRNVFCLFRWSWFCCVVGSDLKSRVVKFRIGCVAKGQRVCVERSESWKVAEMVCGI